MQKRLDYLLEKYSVPTTALLSKDGECVEIDGECHPVLPWRFERRFEELKKLRENQTVSGVSVLRSICIGRSSDNIDKLLIREIDICRWLLDDEAAEIFAITQGSAMNVSLKMKSGVICTIELAATLSESEERISKHELISARGIASDMNVDTQIMQSSVYICGKNSEKYTDVDYELYGLSSEDVATVRGAFALAKSSDVAALHDAELKRLKALVSVAKKSIATMKNLNTGV